MEKRGQKVYLTITEQLESSYSSPIDLTTFDLHVEREAADAAFDRLTALSTDEDQLPRELHSELKQAKAQREIMRALAKEVAIEAATASAEEDLRRLTQ